MRLEAKLAISNAVSKMLLVLLGALVIPPIVQQVAVAHTDSHLREKKRLVQTLIARDGLQAFERGERAETYADYNIFKQEYITLTPLPEGAPLPPERIFEEPRQVDQQVEDFRILSFALPAGGLHQRAFRLEIGSSLETVELLTATLRQLALWVLVAASLLTVVSDAAVAHYLLGPLRELIVRKLRGIRQPSDFNFEVIDTQTTDFRRLDDRLNSLMRQVQSAFAKEREFMSNVSHELLTPVSILQSRFENMLQDPTLPEAHAQQIVESQRTLHRLRNTVRTLLLIANIENEQYLREESVRLSEVVADVAEELDDRRQQRDIDLEVDLTGPDVRPHANASLMHTLLRNLLSNAIKYNHEGGRIRVLGRPAPGGSYTLRVEDTGPGIAAENIPYLFDRFRRFNSNAPGSPEGYGLGLPIAQTIAGFHGATLRAESVVGQGTAFVLDFGPNASPTAGFMPSS
ncbi:HAMP domain-containing sensor histidine kinase [Hymenobacter sp. M29]|uniref:histidine kinase n=1 Tax=Hymenobacter mellowenesis TaxID=3063995 RepID=A0ABT9A8F7_9BACT|nr:HAMP domain-containing sensor histidine kinase [Hymenobacter sp. M29]MDO7845687.1 HAMP domain-containing sensor histidine kinase [Hymenobacter sp. M29]